MEQSVDEVNLYLDDLKQLVSSGKYTIARNKNRIDNENLFIDYVISEKLVKKILTELKAHDFCYTLQNEHENHKDEVLYVFGKEVSLSKRFGDEENDKHVVPLYIKINKINQKFVIVVSFHKQKYPLKYAFK